MYTSIQLFKLFNEFALFIKQKLQSDISLSHSLDPRTLKKSLVNSTYVSKDVGGSIVGVPWSTNDHIFETIAIYISTSKTVSEVASHLLSREVVSHIWHKFVEEGRKSTARDPLTCRRVDPDLKFICV